ncbi:cilia- and flagella-associated protein 77-like [Lineus longissimus]|uniref:cilia- and flagella-associated protein 77-like n=1 Tax=Lineus longissimus TaxID=88925 RepID=UPI002B4E5ACA
MATDIERLYKHTAAGELGCHRETMLNNQLLLRPQLGRPLRRGYNVPIDGFTYGRPNRGIDGGTAEAMTGWTGQEDDTGTVLPLRRKSGSKTQRRDFKGLNRAAVQGGLVNAREQYDFRATHDVRKKLSDEDKNKNRTRRIPPTMVFGISTRPSTPVFDLLEHKYQDRWLEERRQAELAKSEKELSKKNTSGKVYETRASLLRTYQNPVEPAPLWQMSRFTRSAKPALATFRSGPAGSAAFQHHESDCISRKGVQGHGIYESAKN